MIRRKKEIKRIFISILFIITICLSNVQILNNFITFQDEKTNNNFNDNFIDENLQGSNRNIDDIYTGSGVDQDVRIYTTNSSKNELNNEEFFEIPSLASHNMSLVYGDFNFEFQSNFTTDYVIEDDDALYADDYIDFNYDPDYSGITFTNGTPSGGWSFNDLTDSLNGTYIEVNADKGLLNFTISADFSGTSYQSGVIDGRVLFNRSKILSFITSLDFRLYEDADLTVRMFDILQSNWIEVISSLPINSSLGRQRLKEHFINTNLNFIDLTDTCYIQFIFERADSFNARLNGFFMKSTYAIDLPITNETYVALEFDLKGDKSTVNGFYAWIRTLDLVEASTTELNISLYRADRTIVRTVANLRNIDLEPNYNDMIDSVIISGYNGDSLNHFKFDRTKTGNLNVSNYFIVIKSDKPNEVYSLLTLPFSDFGDNTTEHQLKETIDDGNIWSNAKQSIPATGSPYNTVQLDASSFTLNLTRGYMPSDFVVNNEPTLTIQDIPLENSVDSAYPYNESSYKRWGIGQWKHNFTTAIKDQPSNLFRVDLTWDQIITKGFKFNVTYNVNAYWVESALSNYTASYNNDPEWLFTYDFDFNDPSFQYWKFLEFWYVFHNYFIAHNVTNPNNEKILPPGEKQSIIEEDPSKNKIIVDVDIITLNGFYTLNLTSHNFIYDMHSYINYKGILWESKGFMNGDNVTIRADIQDHNNYAPKFGDLNVTLYYPNGTQFIKFNSSKGLIDDSILFYDFDNSTILEVTKDLTIFGEYHLGFLWFNGSAIGCKKLAIYIDKYDVELYNLEYDPLLKSNILDGEIFKYSVSQNYTILVASINETTGLSMPNFYPINSTDLSEQFSYEFGGQNLKVMMTSFLQSQNIINPNETVNVKLSIQNLHEFLSYNVKVEVKLVSFINEQWIIAENTSNPVKLYFSGHPNDSNEFSLDLAIPDLDVDSNIWEGVNAPIRLGGAKAIVNIYINNVNVGEFKSTEFSLISNKTSDNYEGHILGMRVVEGATRKSITFDFDRNECIYFPNNSKFLVNVIDQNYISSYEQFTNEFSLNLNSKFTNIYTNPNKPIEGQSFILSSTLTTEFGKALIGRNVSCQYFNSNNSWVDLGFDITDSKGITSFLINTQSINFKDELLLRLLWEGDTINGITKNVSVNILRGQNNLSISISPNKATINRGRTTTFNVRLENIGNTNLRITNISIGLNKNQVYDIVEIDYITLNWFSAGETSQITVEVSVKDVRRVILSISITAQNVLTNQTIIVSAERTYNTFQVSILDYVIQGFIGIMISLIVLVWFITFLYRRSIKRQMEKPIEEKPVKKPRRGYVPVAELKKPKPVKKIVKKKEEPKEEEKTDLDSLLEERGLADNKKKSEK